MKTIYLSGQISNQDQVKGNFTYAALEVMFMQPDEVDVISPLEHNTAVRSQDVAMSYDSGCMGDGVQVSGYPPATELDLFTWRKN